MDSENFTEVYEKIFIKFNKIYQDKNNEQQQIDYAIDKIDKMLYNVKK